MHYNCVPRYLPICLLFFVLVSSQVIGFRNAQGTEECIDYDSKSNLVTVFCDTTISSLYDQLGNDNLLRPEFPGIWILNVSLRIESETNFVVNNLDTSWLKLVGGNDQLSSITVFGSMDIENVKITSWNPGTADVVKQNVDGTNPRPYILVDKSSGTLNISNSEIAFLGFNQFPYNGVVYSRGGDGSKLINNSFHDMWDGFYSESVGFMTLKDNEFFSNMRYGINIHTSSHDIEVLGNLAFNNTRVGISSSEDCYAIFFRDNIVHENGDAGLMFSLNTTKSLMSNNVVSDELVGISIFSSSNNNIINNEVRSSVHPIFIPATSLNNHLSNNTIIRD